MQKMEYNTYYDKVLGGWVGKCAGGILGAPIEGFKRFNTIALTDSLFENNFPNDDLDLQILWLDMVLKKGSLLMPRDFSEHWKNHVDFPWNEYGVATRNIMLGLHNPDSGKHNNRYWNESMGSPIRSELWGMLCPGQPERAAAYAKMDSTVDHTGFSVAAEEYLSACAALAFFETDIPTLLKQSLAFIDADSSCYHMIARVMDWNTKYSYEVVAGKIKSAYGDADFTSAPMNIAFTVLSLLHSGKSFDSLIDALRLGHDSDCIVATAGALLGIMVGYEKLPEAWKERVGNELMVSPEIVGISCPDTITELTELTCKAGMHFNEVGTHLALGDGPADNSFTVPARQFLIANEVLETPDLRQNMPGKLAIAYTNVTDAEHEVFLACTSPYLNEASEAFRIPAGQTKQLTLPLVGNQQTLPKHATTLPYTLSVSINGSEIDEQENGIPQYGSWLLLGPFIADDPGLEPHHPIYPDHGLSALPSARYMNHDKVALDTEYLTPSKIRDYLSEKSLFHQAFMATKVRPNEMNIPLGNHFYGKGERTVYLYTEITCEKNEKQWLCLGTTAYTKIWHEDELVYTSEDQKRKWPGTHFTELSLKKGKNGILIRLDFATDTFDVEIGLKDHLEKHPHQSQWNTTLQFTAP